MGGAMHRILVQVYYHSHLEIKFLKKLQHANVVKLKEIVTSKGPEKEDNIKPGDANIHGVYIKDSIYMVFEYMDHDLTGLSDPPGMRFSIPQIKRRMLLICGTKSASAHYTNDYGTMRAMKEDGRPVVVAVLESDITPEAKHFIKKLKMVALSYLMHDSYA